MTGRGAGHIYRPGCDSVALRPSPVVVRPRGGGPARYACSVISGHPGTAGVVATRDVGWMSLLSFAPLRVLFLSLVLWFKGNAVYI